MNEIIVRSEFCSTCIWRHNGDNIHEMTFEEVGVPETLRQRIRDWNGIYSDTESASAGSEQYEREGLAIAVELKTLVGDRSTVVYVGLEPNGIDGTFIEVSGPGEFVRRSPF